MSQPDVEEEKHVSPKEGEERERRKERKEEEKLSGSEHDTRSSSLGLRKIRVFPENSEKISGGEKARSSSRQSKACLPAPSVSTLGPSETRGEENF